MPSGELFALVLPLVAHLRQEPPCTPLNSKKCYGELSKTMCQKQLHFMPISDLEKRIVSLVVHLIFSEFWQKDNVTSCAPTILPLRMIRHCWFLVLTKLGNGYMHQVGRLPYFLNFTEIWKSQRIAFLPDSFVVIPNQCVVNSRQG